MKHKIPSATASLLEPYQIILRPIVSERAFAHSEHQNSYTFEVHKDATKLDIRTAIESLFDVKVEQVRTQNRKGKTKLVRNKVFQGKVQLRSWKKAVVKLHPDSRINYY